MNWWELIAVVAAMFCLVCVSISMDHSLDRLAERVARLEERR